MGKGAINSIVLIVSVVLVFWICSFFSTKNRFVNTVYSSVDKELSGKELFNRDWDSLYVYFEACGNEDLFNDKGQFI